jgi:hypothetical protein
MDVIVRSIVGATAVLALLGATGTDEHAPVAIEGRRCFGSEMAINNNLPFYETSDETDINRIEGIYVPAAHRLVGWLYTTRSGRAFIQIGSKANLDAVFRSVGDDDLAAIVAEGKPFAYYPLPTALTKAIRLKPSIVLAACYGTGK